MRTKTFAAIAAISLIAAGSAAAAQTARPLSLANSPAVQRAGAEVQGESAFLRRSGWILGVLALGILVFVVIEANKDHPLPGSP